MGMLSSLNTSLRTIILVVVRTQGDVSAERLRAHMAPYASTCDYPSCIYWKEQLAAYPDAKVVHSTRSADSWAVSVLETIFVINSNYPSQPWGIWLLQRLFPLKVGRPMARMLRACMVPRVGDDYSAPALHAYFRKWEASVVAECPKDKLLVFEAKAGWDPLCKFLGLSVPNVPYPHVNDTAEFKRILFAMNTAGWVWTGMLGVGIAYAAKKLVG